MSHSVKVIIIADQELQILGDVVNIHNLSSIELDSYGRIIGYTANTARINDADFKASRGGGNYGNNR